MLRCVTAQREQWLRGGTARPKSAAPSTRDACVQAEAPKPATKSTAVGSTREELRGAQALTMLRTMAAQITRPDYRPEQQRHAAAQLNLLVSSLVEEVVDIVLQEEASFRSSLEVAEEFSHGGAFVNREIKVNVGAVHEALEDLDAFEREVSKRRFDF